MKVLIINGSPKKEASVTDMLIQPMIKGMEKAGAEINLFYVANLKIQPCTGCLYCLYNGKCKIDDDMKVLLPFFRECKIWVFAAPIYVNSLPGTMKTIIDRTLVLFEPYFEIRAGKTQHKLREKSEIKKSMALVVNGGCWEKSVFDPSIGYAKACAESCDHNFAGSLIRPHGPVMRNPLLANSKNKITEVLEAAEEAGRQLIINGKITKKTMDKFSQSLISKKDFVDKTNKYFDSILKSKNK